ncbi:pilus assembly protein TadG-related protein [Azospirillum sp. TSO22-1]|uniref:pilus assembly protein TadG-related protein n=1 Tax=Azospirillum sp. TSO22-1 TaxID=716789 RepID=UPI000D60639C|nr:pilus assembly protein TadG-related protein [Azospirillum sp. TSO22-1]PWC52788.1 hypothetical protein TSO221_12900 [Azospirillum sp. TSO22-1]
MRRLRSILTHLRRNEDGALIVAIALMLTVLMGLLGVGVEVGSWYMARRSLQTAADAAAIAGALENARGNAAAIALAGAKEAARNGTENGDTVQVFTPPTGGAFAGRADAVEAIVTRRQPALFSAVLNAGPATISARAVALLSDNGRACVLALDGSKASAVLARGNPDVQMAGCMIASNSNAASAIDLSGNVSVNALSLWTAGGIAVSGNASLRLAQPATTHSWPLPDPYTNINVPPLPTCSSPKVTKVNKTQLLPKGIYCGGIDVSGNTHLKLEPGEYYLDQGDLTVHGNVTIDCPTCVNDGVTIVFTSTRSSSLIGGLRLSGNLDLTLQARGGAGVPFPGILVYQDRRAPAGTNLVNGNTTMKVTGALYFPAQELQWAGNNSTATAGCVQIVARTVTFIGNAALGNDTCAAIGAAPIVTTLARLGE